MHAQDYAIPQIAWWAVTQNYPNHRNRKNRGWALARDFTVSVRNISPILWASIKVTHSCSSCLFTIMSLIIRTIQLFEHHLI